MGQYGVHGSLEILPRCHLVTLGAGGIELPSVDEVTQPIQEEEIRGAGGMPGVGDFLALIHQIREIPARPLGEGG